MRRLTVSGASVVAVVMAMIPLEAKAGDGSGEGSFDATLSNPLVSASIDLFPQLAAILATYDTVSDPAFVSNVSQFFANLANPNTTLSTLGLAYYAPLQAAIDNALKVSQSLSGPSADAQKAMYLADVAIPLIIRLIANSATQSIQNTVNNSMSGR